MLTRNQILLEEWQVEHYKRTADKYDVSFSEMIRMALCIDIMFATKTAFPKYNWPVDMKFLQKAIKKPDKTRIMGAEKFHTFMSKLYFEARKATELWINK